MNDIRSDGTLKELLRHAKELAVRYYELTGKPLGVTGEIAEYEASEKLGLVLAPPRTGGFDVYRRQGDFVERFQVKGLAVSTDNRYRGRVPKINCNGAFEAVLLVLLDRSSFEAIEIWRAEREPVISRLTAPGSKARNERGSMGIRQFRSIARCVWPQQGGKPPLLQDPPVSSPAEILRGE